MPPRPPSAANNGPTAWPGPLRRGWCATDTGLRAIVSAGVCCDRFCAAERRERVGYHNGVPTNGISRREIAKGATSRAAKARLLDDAARFDPFANNIERTTASANEISPPDSDKGTSNAYVVARIVLVPRSG